MEKSGNNGTSDAVWRRKSSKTPHFEGSWRIKKRIVQADWKTYHRSGWKKNLHNSVCESDRRGLVDFAGEFSVAKQAELLGINRSTLYYKSRFSLEEYLKINRFIDEIYTAYPFFGYRRITVWLAGHYGIELDPKTVLKHMQEMGIRAIYPRPSLSKSDKENKIYPYLLKDVEILRPNQVWSIDITYIPIRSSFLYLTAIIDWYSRYVISWEIDDTLDIGFVLETCQKALSEAVPEIMNSDQGSHFTSSKYTDLFLDKGCKISMDHCGRAYDNIFIERLWRSVKYENIYPNEYDTPREARTGINDYFKFYNEKRPHQSLNYRTPVEVHFGL